MFAVVEALLKMRAKRNKSAGSLPNPPPISASSASSAAVGENPDEEAAWSKPAPAIHQRLASRLMYHEAVDTTNLQRLYFDASHWNRLRNHAGRDKIVGSFSRRKRVVFPSVINAAELLNTPEPDKRADLCGLMASFLDERHTILDYPRLVLEAAVEARRAKDPSLTLTESAVAMAFRRWVEAPGDLNAAAQAEITGLTDAVKEDNAEFRKELGAIFGKEGFAGDATELIRREDFARLLYEKVPEVAHITRSPDEVHELISEVSVCAWYASAIAYEFHLRTQDLSKKERKKLPGGPDMRQLAYLGLVTRFVARDPDLLTAARWIAAQLPEEMRPDILASDDYFARIGYPFR